MVMKDNKILYYSEIMNYNDIKQSDLGIGPLVSKNYKEDVLDNVKDLVFTDNLLVARNKENNINVNSISLSKPIIMGSKKEIIYLPNILVIYRVSTSKGNFSKLKSNRYLDDYDDNKYVTDIIYRNSYKIKEIIIGEDYLHPKQIIEIQEVSNLKKEILDILEERKYALEVFLNAIKDISLDKRKKLKKNDIKLLKIFYRSNGLKYMIPSRIEINYVEDMIDYLLCLNWKKDEKKIDFDLLNYIVSLSKVGSINMLVDFIKEDIESNNLKKKKYLDKKIKKDIFLTKTFFDDREVMLKSVLRQINTKLNKCKVNIGENEILIIED